MADIFVSRQARAELAAIWDYIASGNINAADRFLESAQATFQQLTTFPGMGRETTFEQPRLKGLRCFPVNGFADLLIFYFAAPGGIQVLRVLHRARNLDSLFTKDEA